MTSSIATRASVPASSLDRVDDGVTGMLKERLGRRRTLTTGQTESLTPVIFSLEEPWRSRFPLWLSDRANGGCGTRLPSQRQGAVWLDDKAPSRKVAVLLDKWLGKTL